MSSKKRPLVINKKLKSISVIQVIQIILVIFILVTLPIHNIYAVRSISEEINNIPQISVPSPAPIPVVNPNASPLELTARGVTVYDVNSSMMIFSKNPHVKLLPASTTKIMTALVTIDEYKMSDIVTVKTVNLEGQKMGLVLGETMEVENLLYGILVHSANDAAYALAEHNAKGTQGFIEKMNEKAVKLHLTNSHFANPVGFDDPEQYTTAADLGKMSLVAIKDPRISKIAGIREITVSDTTYSYFHPLKNINELLGKIPGVSGLKTGFTEAAGQALVTTSINNGNKILIVILGSQDRFQETTKILDWISQNVTWLAINPP